MWCVSTCCISFIIITQSIQALRVNDNLIFYDIQVLEAADLKKDIYNIR